MAAKQIRLVYGETLAAMGKENDKIVVLDADVSASTQTQLFGKEFPDRFFDMGIAESNMVSTAAGLAKMGFIPYANTFAVFITSIGLVGIRSLACYPNANVKLGGAYCGMSDALDGATHHSLEDIAVLRALPNMHILCPSDAVSCEKLTRLSAEIEGPCYLRLSRDAYPDLYKADDVFAVGKGKTVRRGRDVTIIACGSMVHTSLAAAKALAAEDISVRVVDMYSLKPLDKALVWKCAKETGAIVTAEEHNVNGGLGDAVASAVAEGNALVPIEKIGMKDTFSESGAYADLLAKYGLDDTAIAAAVKKVLKRKAKV